MTKRTHISILFAVFLISTLFFAFYSAGSYNSDGDNKDYQTVKAEFYKTFLNYKDNLSKGIITNVPVDQTGTFYVNSQGNFDVRVPKNIQSDNINPQGTFPSLVSTYAFTQSTTTFTTIVGGTGTVLITSACDDSYLMNYPIGFTFNYNGSPFTAFCVSCNGWANLGASGTNNYYTPLCSGTINCLAPFAADLYGVATGNGIYYQTSGSAPNRILTIEWAHWGVYSSGLNELDFQIKLFEATGAVQFVYKPETPTASTFPQVGIMGASVADFNTRTETTGWATTTAGTACSNNTYSSSIFPANGLTFQWAPPAPPPVPVLVRPLNGSTGRYLYDTLQWNPSTGATAYNMQIAVDSLFSGLVLNDTTMVATSYTVGQFSPLTTWWWRVRAKNAVGWSAFSTAWKFKTMGAASQVALYTPANNAVNQPIAFTTYWGKAVDLTDMPNRLNIFNGGKDNIDAVSAYWYELYTDTTIAAVIKDSTLTDTTRAISGLLNAQNYWWRVKAKNNVGWGSFSAYFKFTTVVAAPVAPANVYPANNVIGIIPTTFIDWTTIAGATQYKLQVSSDSTFATTQLDSVTTVDSLYVPAGRLTNNVKYYWHVRSQNVGGNSAYGPTWNFTTSLVGVISNGEIPKVFKLYSAYPNPFNPSTTIRFDLPKAADVKIEVFNLLGQSVALLVDQKLEAGSFRVDWNAANNSSGVYFYRINSGTNTDIKKMVLIK